MTTAKVFCGGAAVSAAGCPCGEGVCCVAGAEVCGAGCPCAAGACVEGPGAENVWAAAIINMKKKQIRLLGTPTRIPESFQSREIVRLIFSFHGKIEANLRKYYSFMTYLWVGLYILDGDAPSHQFMETGVRVGELEK